MYHRSVATSEYSVNFFLVYRSNQPTNQPTANTPRPRCAGRTDAACLRAVTHARRQHTAQIASTTLARRSAQHDITLHAHAALTRLLRCCWLYGCMWLANLATEKRASDESGG